jgi:hypothetical protein
MQIVFLSIGLVGHHAKAPPEFYSACVTIFPILIVAGFVELGADSGDLEIGVGWRLLEFVLPAIAGEIVCLWALTENRSTTFTVGMTWANLAMTMTALILLVFGRATKKMISRERRPHAADGKPWGTMS